MKKKSISNLAVYAAPELKGFELRNHSCLCGSITQADFSIDDENDLEF